MDVIARFTGGQVPTQANEPTTATHELHRKTSTDASQRRQHMCFTGGQVPMQANDGNTCASQEDKYRCKPTTAPYVLELVFGRDVALHVYGAIVASEENRMHIVLSAMQSINAPLWCSITVLHITVLACHDGAHSRYADHPV
jgi:hypothetical protein